MAQLFIGTRHALGFGMLAVYERNIMLIPEIELPIRNADLPREIDSKDRHEVILLIIIICHFPRIRRRFYDFLFMTLNYKGETFDLSFDINMFEIFRKFFINLKNNVVKI